MQKTYDKICCTCEHSKLDYEDNNNSRCRLSDTVVELHGSCKLHTHFEPKREIESCLLCGKEIHPIWNEEEEQWEYERSPEGTCKACNLHF